MITDHFKSRGYQVLAQNQEGPAFWSAIDGCAQFLYKGFMISLSTSGRSQGACMSPVCIYTGMTYEQIHKDGFHTVEEAIDWLNEHAVDDAYNALKALLLDKKKKITNDYVRACRVYMIDNNINHTRFEKYLGLFLGKNPDLDRETFIQILTDTEMSEINFHKVMQFLLTFDKERNNVKVCSSYSSLARFTSSDMRGGS